MSGWWLVGLIRLSRAWLFFVYGLALHYLLLRRALTAKEGEYVPSSMGFIPGVVGSAAVVFTIAALAKYDIEVPWSCLWILLPLVIDPYCPPIVAVLLIRKVSGLR
jgi:hypothetical protein